jgi:NAD(P)-dependent dehydrogenase (short-subunit alcohol dehydrogenase family)
MASGDRAPGKVLVTGAASGIGAAIVARLAADGWSALGADIAPVEGPAEPLTADLADEAQCRRLAERARGATALVHAAGFMRTGELGKLDPADGAAMWAVHVRALVILAQVLVPQMPPGGRVLAIGSRTSAGAAAKSQYAACKAAVTGLVRSWAIELAPRGVTANVIAPAATNTALLSDPGRADVAPAIPPIGRLIEPGEIAAYAAFILSPEADAITGQELMICGGASL